MNAFGRETELLEENMPRLYFIHHKSHLPYLGRRGGKPATNRISYGAAEPVTLLIPNTSGNYRTVSEV
jgi:hypothetical protein